MLWVEILRGYKLQILILTTLILSQILVVLHFSVAQDFWRSLCQIFEAGLRGIIFILVGYKF